MKNKLLTIIILGSMITGAYLYRNELIERFIALQSSPELSKTFVDREEPSDSGMNYKDLDSGSKLGEVLSEKVGNSDSTQLVEKIDSDESVESKVTSVAFPEKTVNGNEVIEDEGVRPDDVMIDPVRSNISTTELSENKVLPDSSETETDKGQPKPLKIQVAEKNGRLGWIPAKDLKSIITQAMKGKVNESENKVHDAD